MSELEASARQQIAPPPKKLDRVRYTIHLDGDEEVEVITAEQPHYEDGWATFKSENGNSITFPREGVRFYTTEYLEDGIEY